MSVIDRRQLGALLRQARQARGLKAQQVIDQLAKIDVTISTSTLTQWEQGKRAPRPQDVKPLLTLYDISGEEAETMLQLARGARQKSWWSSSAGALRASFTTLMGLEAEAVSMAQYSVTVIPGLVQTREYAEAVMAAASPPLSDETITTRVDVRMRRQEILLLGENSKLRQLHLVLDEGCIRRQVGGITVWRDQLRSLLSLAERRRIIVQVLPFAVGSHAGTLGGFTIMNFTDQPPIAYVELTETDLSEEGPGADGYRLRFDKLREQALPEPLSLRLIKDSVANEKD